MARQLLRASSHDIPPFKRVRRQGHVRRRGESRKQRAHAIRKVRPRAHPPGAGADSVRDRPGVDARRAGRRNGRRRPAIQRAREAWCRLQGAPGRQRQLEGCARRLSQATRGTSASTGRLGAASRSLQGPRPPPEGNGPTPGLSRLCCATDVWSCACRTTSSSTPARPSSSPRASARLQKLRPCSAPFQLGAFRWRVTRTTTPFACRRSDQTGTFPRRGPSRSLGS